MNPGKGRSVLLLAMTALAVIATAMVLTVSISADSGSTLSGSLFNGNDGTLDSNAILVAKDIVNIKADDSFTGGTNSTDVNVTVDDGSIPPNKSNLDEFHYGTNTVGSNVFLYLAWSRYEKSGTVALDFEFNIATTTFPAPPHKNTDVHLNRTIGDLLVTYDFQGGADANLGFYRWNGSSWVLAGTSTTSNAESSVSADELFGEATINLTAAGLIPSGSCINFSQAWVKSRASNTFNNELKDFIAPGPVNINTCQPSSVVVHKRDTSATPVPLDGAVFELYRETSSPLNTTLDSADTLIGSCTSGVPTAGSGDCSFTGITVAGLYYVKEVTAPAGYALPNPAVQSVTVVIDSTAHTYEVTFNDPPLYKLIVFTCTQQGKPVVGNVNLSVAGQANSLASKDTDAVSGSAGNPSIADLVCAQSYTAGANFGNLAANTYNAVTQDPKQ